MREGATLGQLASGRWIWICSADDRRLHRLRHDESACPLNRPTPPQPHPRTLLKSEARAAGASVKARTTPPGRAPLYRRTAKPSPLLSVALRAGADVVRGIGGGLVELNGQRRQAMAA